MNHHDDMEMGEIVVSESVLTEAQSIVEAIAATHLSITMSNDVAIAAGDGPVYTASLKLFKAAIHAAYPELSEESIYHMWSECNESIEYCASWFMKEVEPTPVNEGGEWEDSMILTYVHVRQDSTGDEMIISRRTYEDHFNGFGWFIMGTMNKEDAHILCDCKPTNSNSVDEI